MNPAVKQILGLGTFFAGAVIILDALLLEIPNLDWLALGIVFFMAAGSILISISRTIPFHRQIRRQMPENGNDLDHLTDTVEAGIYGGDSAASRRLTDEIKSVMMGAIALRTKLAKRDVVRILEHPGDLQITVRDDEIMKFLAGYRQSEKSFNEVELEKMLSQIESWTL